jgi:uncharacterized damage-inducible protein DinB
MKALLLFALLLGTAANAQEDKLEGVWQGFDGEWLHVSRQIVSLAESIPADKYSWRPAAGVRSTAEVINHVTLANFFLLRYTGPALPADLKAEGFDNRITEKADAIAWLKRSLDAVKAAHAGIKPEELQRKVKVSGRDATVDGMYLRIIVHANEHMGQLVAYARVNGIAPPWSAPAK